MQQVIINVDDCGLHPAVQRAVEDLHQRGIVTSTSLMANGPYITDAQRLPKTLGLATHLNVLRGKPILPASQIPSLVDKNGLFLNSFGAFFKRYLFKQIKLEEVKKEWSAQIESLLSLGFTLTHLDSEKHHHCLPGLFEIANTLAKKYSVPYVRYSKEQFNWSMPLSKQLKAQLIALSLSTCKKDPSIQYPDAIWGISNQNQLCNYHYFKESLKQIKNDGIIEIACHPGLREKDDPELDPNFGKTRVADQWLTEWKLLSGKDWQKIKTESRLCHPGSIQ